MKNKKLKNKSIQVRGIKINYTQFAEDDFISLTDIARYKDQDRSDYIIQNWLRNRDTIEFMGLWEKINNPNFKSIEFDGFRNKAGLNSFSLTPKRWVEQTNAIGIVTKKGRYGGTYAHKDIAFEFASWISAEFKLFLIKEFQRLKKEEIERKELQWDLKRNLAAVNYRIHTDAVQKYLVPPQITSKQASIIYANEADVLNKALFGLTAKEWREQNPKKKGNVRDYATASQLVCLTNLESLNSELIKQEISQSERLKKLNQVAIAQMRVLVGVDRKRLGKGEKE